MRCLTTTVKDEMTSESKEQMETLYHFNNEYMANLSIRRSLMFLQTLLKVNIASKDTLTLNQTSQESYLIHSSPLLMH